jgi:S1-C subfamily serine protease
MKKRILSFFLTVMLFLFAFPVNCGAVSGLSNFQAVNSYQTGQFQDVPSGQWYTEYVQKAYEYGLINGISATEFAPTQNLQLSQAIKLAACLHSIYYTGTAQFASGNPWYQPYVDYALSNGIIDANYPDYNVTATRAEFAQILAKALPDEALPQINTVEDGAIPDVPTTAPYSDAVYKLYRAGILTGNDSAGTFYPNSFILRQEVATIVTRMADTGLRKYVTLNVPLTAEGVFQKCSPAVFYIEIYNSDGTAIGSGSGFFISAGGVAVTNYHVIKSAASASIQTTDGKKYQVLGVYDYSIDNDLALLQINGSGFPFLTDGDSQSLSTGATVYAIGSPLGLDNTLSQGIISNAKRTLDGVDYIQMTAAISPGSSGGALLNTKGQVIGVTSATSTTGQNINLAIPIHLVSELQQNTYVSLSTISTQINNAMITSSVSTVKLAAGEEKEITVTQNMGNYIYVYYTIEDESIAAGRWGDWSDDGTSLPFTIYGLSAGTTTLTLELYSEYRTLLASTTVTITVSAGQETLTEYYYGYYPVPDYGAFSGANFDFIYDNPDNYTITFFYNVLDIQRPINDAIAGYVNLLNQNDFYYVKTTSDDELLFQNDIFYYQVLIGMAADDTNDYLYITINY